MRQSTAGDEQCLSPEFRDGVAKYVTQLSMCLSRPAPPDRTRHHRNLPPAGEQMDRYPDGVFLRDSMDASYRQPRLACKRRREPGQFGIARKAEGLRLHSLVGRIAAVLVPCPVVDEKAFPRHPVC